jgi:hypothetical protein
VFDTAVVNVGGSGTINLKNEEMDLQLKPEPKDRGIGSLRTPLHVKGTFGNPNVGPTWASSVSRRPAPSRWASSTRCSPSSADRGRQGQGQHVRPAHRAGHQVRQAVRRDRRRARRRAKREKKQDKRAGQKSLRRPPQTPRN